MKTLVLHKLIAVAALVLMGFQGWFLRKPQRFSVASEMRVSQYQTRLSDTITLQRAVTVDQYFAFMDSLVRAWDSITPYPLSEHLVVRANPWLIDTLQHTDYYYMQARDSFVYDQKTMLVLPKGARLVIPDSLQVQQLLTAFKNTVIDVNIPEFKLRIYESEQLLYEIPVRVGRHEKKYLEMSGRIQDLRTKTGEGTIVGHNRNPRYVNPVNNHEYFVTKRDDGKVTKLPRIPFIETELNGMRYGQLIHPTTNPVTLGKAYSNGCIGTLEADAWRVYYQAPIGTKIRVRYALKVRANNGDTLLLKDIYQKRHKG